MTDNLMDMTPGGQNDQYSSANTFTRPHKTSTGQLGAGPDNDSNNNNKNEPSRTAGRAERGERTAANIRYGQGISEGGVGGMTVGNDGVAGQAVGYGRVAAGADGAGGQREVLEEEEEEEEEGKGTRGGDRVAQGLGGDREMGGDVGA